MRPCHRLRAIKRLTCKHGHPWTAENTYVYPNGKRRCRACHAANARRARRARRQMCSHHDVYGYSGDDDRPWGHCLVCGVRLPWDQLFPKRFK